MTPRGAMPDDFAQWRRHVENQLRRLAALASYRPGLRVDVGDFEVSGGGSVIVKDGGGVKVEDGGNITWYDENMFERVYIGDIFNVDDDSYMGPGLLVQRGDAEGTDILRASSDSSLIAGPGTNQGYMFIRDDRLEIGGPGDSGFLQYNRNDHDSLALRRNNGNALFDVWKGDDGPQLTLWRHTGTETFNVGQTWYRYRHGEDIIFQLDKRGGGNTLLFGGATTDGNASRECMQMVGGTGNRVFRFMDGAASTYVPCTASDWRTASSGQLKNVEGDADRLSALADVRATPIKRWRAKPEFSGQDSYDVDAGEQAETSERIEPWAAPIGPEPLPAAESMRLRTGPVAEEAPESIRDDDDDMPALSLSDSLFTLWAAVQELSSEVDRLRSRVADLEAGEAAEKG